MPESLPFSLGEKKKKGTTTLRGEKKKKKQSFTKPNRRRGGFTIIKFMVGMRGKKISGRNRRGPHQQKKKRRTRGIFCARRGKKALHSFKKKEKWPKGRGRKVPLSEHTEKKKKNHNVRIFIKEAGG